MTTWRHLEAEGWTWVRLCGHLAAAHGIPLDEQDRILPIWSSRGSTARVPGPCWHLAELHSRHIREHLEERP